MRYLAENHKQSVLALSNALKLSDSTQFETLLGQIATDHNDDFQPLLQVYSLVVSC